MEHKLIKTNILAQRIIPHVNAAMKAQLNLPEDHTSIGMFTCDNDDVAFIALDDATKKANIQVAHVEPSYGGVYGAWGKLHGAVIAVISGPRVSDVISGMGYINDFVENHSSLYGLNEEETIAYYAYCIDKIGSYYAKSLGLKEGSSLAYIASAPLEAMYGIDAAVKAADVKIVEFWGPPTVTNCGGALLTGTQSACKAAVEAFRHAVGSVAGDPLNYRG